MNFIFVIRKDSVVRDPMDKTDGVAELEFSLTAMGGGLAMLDF